MRAFTQRIATHTLITDASCWAALEEYSSTIKRDVISHEDHRGLTSAVDAAKLHINGLKLRKQSPQQSKKKGGCAIKCLQ
jgi:hypothetical protein